MLRKTLGSIFGLITAALIIEALARLFFPHWAPRTGTITFFGVTIHCWGGLTFLIQLARSIPTGLNPPSESIQRDFGMSKEAMMEIH